MKREIMFIIIKLLIKVWLGTAAEYQIEDAFAMVCQFYNSKATYPCATPKFGC